jgi:hypothetical protein
VDLAIAVLAVPFANRQSVGRRSSVNSVSRYSGLVLLRRGKKIANRHWRDRHQCLFAIFLPLLNNTNPLDFFQSGGGLACVRALD